MKGAVQIYGGLLGENGLKGVYENVEGVQREWRGDWI